MRGGGERGEGGEGRAGGGYVLTSNQSSVYLISRQIGDGYIQHVLTGGTRTVRGRYGENGYVAITSRRLFVVCLAMNHEDCLKERLGAAPGEGRHTIFIAPCVTMRAYRRGAG